MELFVFIDGKMSKFLRDQSEFWGAIRKFFLGGNIQEIVLGIREVLEIF